MTSVCISPRLSRINKAESTGGISRVVEAQVRWLSEYGIEVVDDSSRADILASHAGSVGWNKVGRDQKLVSHCHGLYWAQDNWGATWYEQVNAEVIDSMRQADAITVPSGWVADSVKRGTLLDVKVIGHGVDLDSWALDAGESRDHNGYIFWDKARQDTVCNPKPVNVLASAIPSIRFVSTFGDEATNVRITGEMPRSEHKGLMQHAMLYLATARETFGISILEALACGVPIVGWDWGGQAEIVNREVGWLATPGDYASLVQGIRYCTEHRQEMSQAARALVESKYQWKHVIEKYADLYTSIVAVGHQKKVTVTISSYNLGKYLPDAIESVLHQDFKDVETIVVDDCSTDGSLKVAQEYAATYAGVKVLKTKKNSNMPTVLNLGIDNSVGEYILNLDADNMLAPGALSVLVDALDNNRDLDIVYGKIKFVLDDGKTPDVAVTGTGDGISGWPPQIASRTLQLAHKNQIPSTALVRRRLVEQVGGYRHRCFRIGEDPDFWCRALSVGAKAVRVTDAPTLIYRMRDESRSHIQPEWAWEKWYDNSKPIQIGGPINIVDTRPQVSFVIPVGPGHGRQGIEDALDSIYNQQGSVSWEAIVIDDTDNEIRWLPTWVRRFSTSKPKSGASVARNIGISSVQGECFVLLDADDYLAPEFLSKMYPAYLNGGGGYVYCDFYKDSGASVVNIDKFECKDQLHNLRHPITCMYPRNIRDLVQFDESMRVGEDWDYVLGVLSNGWCGVHVTKPLVYYRQQSGNNRRGLIENIVSIRQRMQEKWGDKMGCGCGKGGGFTVDNSSNAVAKATLAAQAGAGDLVLLEFVKPGVSTMSWTGQVTGHPYRFGSNEGHRIGYVHRGDAEEFLKRTEFAIAQVE